MAEQSPTPGVVWVIGSVNVDLVVQVSRHPRPGETVRGEGVRLRPGGKGANQALAAARAGADVTLVGRIGSDRDGARYREELSRRGVNVDHLQSSRDEITGRAIICVAPHGENTIVVIPGANAELSEPDVDALVTQPPGVVLLQLEIPPRTVEHSASLFASRGSRIILNPSPLERLSPALMTLADPLVVNEHEAAQLAGAPEGEADPASVARRLISKGARSVVITLGAAGAYVADRSSGHHLAAPAVDAVDTTGAGDAFAGTLAAALARGVRLPAAAASAVAAASAATGWSGAQDWTLDDPLPAGPAH